MTPRSDPAAGKRAARIAATIEGAILDGRWPVGHRIGQEAALAQAHGVSRWTMREALAILEQAGSIVARRGAGGGLFVAAPAADLARTAIGTYLEFSGVPIESIVAVRLALARLAIDGAIDRLDHRGRTTLAALILRAEAGGVAAVTALAEARQAIREAAGNPALALLLASLADIVLHASWLSALDDATFVGLIDRLAACSRRLVLAVLADARDAAVAAEIDGLAVIRELHAASSVSGALRSVANAGERAYALYPASRPVKKAEAAAWAIRRAIADEGLAPGDNLGSEAELRARHGVGRPVLREAIRILERLGIADMRRGGASGLTVTAPDPARVVALAREHLARLGTGPGDHRAIRDALAPLAPDPAVALMRAIVADD